MNNNENKKYNTTIETGMNNFDSILNGNYDYNKTEDDEKFNNTIKNANSIINDCKKYLQTNELDRALIELSKLADNIDSYIPQKQDVKYFSFSNVLEFLLYTDTFSEDKKTNISWCSFKANELFYYLSYIYVEKGQYTKALEAISKGLKYNPVDTRLHFEKIEVCKKINDIEKIPSILEDIYLYTYDHLTMAKYYRNYGYYLIEKKEYNTAFAIYYLSLFYEKSYVVNSEIGYILSQADKEGYPLKTENIVDTLKVAGIELGPRIKNVDFLNSLIRSKSIHDLFPDLRNFIINEVAIFNYGIEASEEHKQEFDYPITLD